MQKLYSKAPLPFIGQKRNFITAFRAVLTEHIDSDGEGWTIVDVFGGSGLLAHNAKRLLPHATVIYNDFDGYAQRLQNLADTERLRQGLLEYMAEIPHQQPIPKALKHQIRQAINDWPDYVDVQCLATWLLFSGKQVRTLDEIFSQNLYNTVRRSPLENATGYLDGIDVVTQSYTELMPDYFNQPKTLFLLDPPYLCTRQGAYNQDKYFAMVDFLYLMSLTRPPYIFFSSTKSELLDYMDYLKRQSGNDWQRLGGFKRLSLQAHLNKKTHYEDNMLYRFK